MLEQLDLTPLSQHWKLLIFTTMYNFNGIGYFFSVLCRCTPLPALCIHMVVLLCCSVAWGCAMLNHVLMTVTCMQLLHVLHVLSLKLAPQCHAFVQLLGIRMHIFASRHCAGYVCVSNMYMYAGAGEEHVACVTFAHMVCYRRSCLLFVVSKPRWPHHAIVPDFHLHRKRSHVLHWWLVHGCLSLTCN